MIGPRLRLVLRVLLWAFVAAQVIAQISGGIWFQEGAPMFSSFWRASEIAVRWLMPLVWVVPALAMLSIDERLERRA